MVDAMLPMSLWRLIACIGIPPTMERIERSVGGGTLLSFREAVTCWVSLDKRMYSQYTYFEYCRNRQSRGGQATSYVRIF